MRYVNVSMRCICRRSSDNTFRRVGLHRRETEGRISQCCPVIHLEVHDQLTGACGAKLPL